MPAAAAVHAIAPQPRAGEPCRTGRRERLDGGEREGGRGREREGGNAEREGLFLYWRHCGMLRRRWELTWRIWESRWTL